ncbi:MAG TPA: type II secretion system F family protein [Terriglobales bacterium]|jgi:general secretion pathway protein F|nr:type II secretion system F family protein [Terriglobales bacterium]
MPSFAYQAATADGKLVNGAIDAADRLVAVGRLQERGLIPINVADATAASRLGTQKIKALFARQGLAQHRQVFARTLASLLAAGVPLDRSLAVSAELSESPLLRSALEQTLRAVKGGKSLSAALEAHEDLFPSFYISMVRAGEASGNTAAVFAQLADYQESVNELRGQVTSALIYPALLTIVGGTSVFALLEFVVPKFAVVFEQTGAALPLPTQILMNVSNFIRATWWAWLIGIPFAAWLFYRWLQTKEGRSRWDHFILRVPRLGAVIERVLVTRFARSLGTLLQGGVPMIRSLQIAGQVAANTRIAAAVESAAQGVKQGKGLSRPLAETGAFPPLSIHLLGVGEETGRVDAMLLHVADVYERETRQAIKNMVALFEPAMILVMGLVVGTIVISILLAIFSINDIPL